MSRQSENDLTRPIGYIIAIKYPRDNGHENAGTWQADWDGEIHPTAEAAWEVCKKANGGEWRDEVESSGLWAGELGQADYLPFALTLALPDGVLR